MGPRAVLGADGVERVHQQALRILADVGTDVRHDGMRARLHEEGQHVDGERVRWDPDWLLGQVARTPASFGLRGRGPGRDVTVGGGAPPVRTPSGGAPFCADATRGRREGSLADHVELVRLAHVVPEIAVQQSGTVEANDLDDRSRHLDMDYACLRWSDKPYLTYGTTGPKARDGVRLAALAHGGLEAIRARPAIVGIVNPNSPLVWDEMMVDALVEWADAGQPVAVTPFLLGGASAPVPVAAGLALQTAEALTGVAMAQLVRPGTPMLFGSFTTPVDMRSGGPSFGTPEAVLAILAGGELARRYAIPYRGGGGLCSANLLDGQAAAESAMSLWATAMAGSDLVVHAAGWLEGGLCTSYEKLLLDVELLRMLDRLDAGIDLSDDAFALDVIREEGPGGMFLATGHTLERFRDLFMSPLFRSMAHPTWLKAGALDLAAVAALEWPKTLARYEDPGLEPALEAELQGFVEARRAELEAD